MNINKAIRDLVDEKKRLDHVIASLEEMQRNAAAQPVAPAAKKRGRKSVDPQARKEISERMKQYWAARRGNAAKEPALAPARPTASV